MQVADEQGFHLLETLHSGERVHIVRSAGVAEHDKLAALIPLDRSGFGRVEAVLRLLASLYDRAIPTDTRITRQQRLRAKRMLRAVDGRRAGATQREIAKVIFRFNHVGRDEWQAAPERYATMDLIKDGRAMIAGGYRNLLRRRLRP